MLEWISEPSPVKTRNLLLVCGLVAVLDIPLGVLAWNAKHPTDRVEFPGIRTVEDLRRPVIAAPVAPPGTRLERQVLQPARPLHVPQRTPLPAGQLCVDGVVYLSYFRDGGTVFSTVSEYGRPVACADGYRIDSR